jgi:hypothetical protein
MENHLKNLLDRLQLCHLELSSSAGIPNDGVFRTFPLGNVPWSSFPFLMVAPGGAQYTYPSKGYVDIRRDFTITVVISPRTGDTGQDGESQAVIDGEGIEIALINYYISHPTLSTASLSGLVHLEGVLMLSSRGVILSPDLPDNKTNKTPEYIGVQVVLATMIRQYIENSEIEWRFT